MIHNSRFRKLSNKSAGASKILHRVREFFRSGALSLSEEDINQIITHALESLEEEMETPKVDLKLGKKIPPVMMDKVQVQQVLINLV